MSTFKVEVVEIKEVLPHGNADRLEIAKVYDWSIIVQKGRYKSGNKAIYCPVDSILPYELENKIFPPESKIKLTKSRIRSIKIRGIVSQGMLIDLSEIDFGEYEVAVGEDVTTLIGITKYEPPVNDIPNHMKAQQKRAKNSNFKKYTDIENFKYYDRVLQDNEEIYISEKLHGTSFRAGWFLNEPNTLWKKFINLFGLLPKWEFCWGSRNVQIQNKIIHNGYYDVDVYTKIVRQYDLKNRIPKGYAVYGEVVGDGIQKGYTYGCGPLEHRLYVYDISYYGQWLNYNTVQIPVLTDDEAEFPPQITFLQALDLMKLQGVPCLYVGPFERSIAELHRVGDSLIGGQKVREGVVIKPVIERSATSMGRVVLKFINDDYYLLADGTDFH